MAKWHINDNGEVKRCTATLRPCQYVDYRTEAEAHEVLENISYRSALKKKKGDLQGRLDRKEYPQGYFTYDPNDTMGIGPAMGPISRYAKMMGEKPLSHGFTYIVNDGIGNNIVFNRQPSVNNRGEIEAKWYMSSHSSNGSAMSRKEQFLDTQNSFNDSINMASEEAGKVFSYSPRVDMDPLTKKKNGYKSGDFFGALANAIDEREIGPYAIARDYPERGTTFVDSVDTSSININNMLQTTSLDGELLKQYIDENPITEGGDVSEANIRIWDNNHDSPTSPGWAMSYENGKIFFESGIVNSPETVSERSEVVSPLDLKNKVYAHLISQKYSHIAATTKSDYAARMVKDIENALSEKINRDENPEFFENIEQRQKKNEDVKGQVKAKEEELFINRPRKEVKRPVPLKKKKSVFSSLDPEDLRTKSADEIAALLMKS